MEPKTFKSSIIGEEYYYMKHPSGLDIYVYPKKGYSSNYAVLGTRFGSINNKFKFKGEPSFTQIPDGIAHYLEHKLFASEKGDAFELFSKTGASANAYTSFDKTAYLFRCTGNFNDSLNILLDFVQKPYFTEENVEKERGIIGQEIKMYEDDPNWCVYLNLLGAMYKNHPCKIDIAGTVESIAKITPEMLYECYKTFYNLNNMSLCVVGNFDKDDIFMLIDKKMRYEPTKEFENFFPEEPAEVNKSFVSQKFDIQVPEFQLGFKEKVNRGERVSPETIIYKNIINSAFSSPSSELFKELLEKELINKSTFESSYFEIPGAAAVIFSGTSKNPEKTAEVIKIYADKLRKEGLSKEIFERAKKVIYAQNIAVFDSISAIANGILDFSLSKNKEIYNFLEILNSANLESANEILKSSLNSDFSALSVILPNPS